MKIRWKYLLHKSEIRNAKLRRRLDKIQLAIIDNQNAQKEILKRIKEAQDAHRDRQEVNR